MRTAYLPLCAALLAGPLLGASDVRVDFILNTKGGDGASVRENRHYYVYRPAGFPKSTPLPMIVVFQPCGGCEPAGVLHQKANQAGFVVVSASFGGNITGSPGTVWTSNNPRVQGPEDMDYTDEVIRRVRASENCGDAFTVGLSKGGHMSLAYACERPNMIKAAASVDEFMQPTNIPSAPVPIIVFQGTRDTNVPYVMVKDTVDRWRATDGLLNAVPVTTYESSPLLIGNVSQATWRGGKAGTQVAYVTIIGGTHTFATPGKQTGYDFADGIWAFFSQYLTSRPGAPQILSQPAGNVQFAGHPASFWVVASGTGPLRYQWQKNRHDIPGATNNWLTVPASADDGGATFRAVVRNASGEVASAAAKLTVQLPPPGPTITAQPADQTAASGGRVKFTVAATGLPPLRYQWKENGIDIDGATSPSLEVRALTPDCGAAYSVAVSDSTGTALSAPAILTVAPAPGAPVIIENVHRRRVLPGEKATFTVKAFSASRRRYQWQRGGFNGNMADIPGAKARSYSLVPSAPLARPDLFRCIVSNSKGAATSTSEMLMVSKPK